MNIPLDHLNDLFKQLSNSRIENLVAQGDARRILQEVNELPENYPKFDPMLTEKATYISSVLISCGCSILEDKTLDPASGFDALEEAGKILSDIYQYNRDECGKCSFTLLLAGMALYASKQYSRAFIALSKVDSISPSGKMIQCFIKKDFDSLLQISNSVFFSPAPELFDFQEYDEWVITHEIAHCFLIVENHIYTGETHDIGLINDILDNILELAIQSKLISYWLIIRLLKIIISTFDTASLWNILPPLLPQCKFVNEYIRLISSFRFPITELWPSQVEALPLAVGDNPGGIINLRTSGGKTRIAEIAMLKVLAADPDSKILYLAPFRSLAFEVEESLGKVFIPLGVQVSHLYGGATVNVTDLDLIQESRVIIATPEKTKALIRSVESIKQTIKLIIVDEGHLLGPEERHIRNEMFLTHIKEYARMHCIRILLLSAVLPNAADLANWIAGDSNLVAKSNWKPSLERLGFLRWDGNHVRLEWKSEGNPFNPNFIQSKPLGFGRRRRLFPHDKNEAVAATAVRLSKAGTVMIYSARANSIKGLAENVLLALGKNAPDFHWDRKVWNIFESVCQEELPENHIVLTAARKGVICHSNRLPPLVRIVIEKLMRSTQPAIIIATSTLGQGINVGISTVIVSTPYYTDEPISCSDFWNICGRAGRAFSDSEGKILYTIDMTAEKWKIRKETKLAAIYFDNRKIESANSGVLALLAYIVDIAKAADIDLDTLIELIANDFTQECTGDFLKESDQKDINDVLDYIDDELLSMHEELCEEENSIDWIDDVFRRSLAIIQAEEKSQNDYIRILRARMGALLVRIPKKIDRKRVVASGIPLSVATALLQDARFFRDIVSVFNDLPVEDDVYIDQIIHIVKEIDLWCYSKATGLLDETIKLEDLDNIREGWIKGISLAQLSKISKRTYKIVKDYYGFTLPWVIHAISQIFDDTDDESIAEFYSNLATIVELGLPTQTAVNVYMAGVRSRSAALELAQLAKCTGKTSLEIKAMIFNSEFASNEVSENAQSWFDILSGAENAPIAHNISFPKFTLTEKGLPDKLYVGKTDEQVFLYSSDGYFMKKVKPTTSLPFDKIANLKGVYFKAVGDVWELNTYNPFIKIQ